MPTKWQQTSVCFNTGAAQSCTRRRFILSAKGLSKTDLCKVTSLQSLPQMNWKKYCGIRGWGGCRDIQGFLTGSSNFYVIVINLDLEFTDLPPPPHRTRCVFITPECWETYNFLNDENSDERHLYLRYDWLINWEKAIAWETALHVESLKFNPIICLKSWRATVCQCRQHWARWIHGLIQCEVTSHVPPAVHCQGECYIYFRTHSVHTEER